MTIWRRRIRRWLIVLATLAWAAPVAAETLCDPAYQDCRAPLLSLINNEQVGIDVAFWFMQDTRYESALLNRWRAGVPIRVLVDPRANPAYPGNSQVIADLAAAGIPIRYRLPSSPGILHWKMMLFAGQNQVEFDGANYSPTAFVYEQPYSNYEWESIYFSDDPSIVNSFRTEYDNLWLDTTNYGNYANISGPLTRVYGIYPQDPALNFPQQQDYALRILKNYSKETQGIDVIMYRISDERHTNAMIAAMQRGIPVRIISDTFEYRNTTRLWVAYNLDRLYAAGVPLKVRGGQGLNHQKLVLLYGQQMAVFGSSNWTTPSANQQQEHNYFTTKPWMYQWFSDQFDRKWNNLAPNGAIESTPFVPLPPDKPVNQSPAAGAVGTLRSLELVWDGGPWGQKYDIYFGTDPNPPLLAADQQLGPNDPASPSLQKWILPLLQPGTTYYWRIVSKTMAGVTANGPVASFTTAGTPPPPPQPAPNASTIVIWTATDVAPSNVVGNWQWLTDSTAAGGRALWNPDHGASRISPPLATPANYFTTTFNAVGGVPYHLWVRLRAQGNSTTNNSVSVQFSNAIDQYGSPLYAIGSTQGAEVALIDPSGTLNGWGWDDNGLGGSPATLIYFPASGTQTLQVQQRHDGAIVDQIVLSPDAFLSSPPGGTLNDTTIYGSTIDGSSPPPSPPPGPPPPPDVPAPWQHHDIGAVGLPGYATFDSTSTFNVVAAGADVWGNADSFHYVYEPLSGDGTIVARVASLQQANVWSKAGVMIRESLAPGATNAFMLVSAAKGLSFQARATTGAATTATTGANRAAPYWVRLSRAGNTFTGSYSPDGTTWTQLGTATIPMAASALIGFGVTSHNPDIDTLAAIDNASVNGVPVQACNAAITPTAQTFASGGDTGSIAVSAANSCSWTATSNQSWLTVTSGASGTGNGTVMLSAAPNSGASRTATVSVAGLAFTATQNAANCSFAISPASQAMTASGGAATVTVTTGNWCSWSAVSSDPTWLAVTSGASGTGSGSVTLNAAANNGPARSTTATIAGQTFTVSEPAASCVYTLSPASQSIASGAATLSVALTTGAWCSWTAASADTSWLAVTSAASGTGSATIALTAAANAGAARSTTVAIGAATFAASQAAAALPGGWANQDVGATGKSGTSTYDWGASTFTIKGAGADVWGTADAFQYAYRPLAGDGVMIARVASVSSTNAWVKAGVMIRETLDPGSAQAFMLVSFSKGTAFQRRTVAGGTSTNSTGPSAAAPYWVKLERIGNTINAYASPDGASWTLVGSDTFTMAANVFVGLAVSSHVAGTLATATLDNVSAPSIGCGFTISPSGQSFDATGGSGTIALTATDPSCTWTAASSDPSWLTVTSSASGSGNALVGITAAANSGGARNATVTIGDQTFSASQAAAACTYSISPTNQLLAYSGDTATVAVTTGSWCSWTASSGDPTWLTVTSGASGTGNGTATLTASANTGGTRSTTATIAGQTFNAQQASAPCTFSITPSSQAMATGGDSATIAVTTSSWCTWTATSSDPSWLTISGPSAGTGSGSVAVAAAANPAGARSATIAIADRTFTATQAAAACSYAISPASQSAAPGGGTATIAMTTGSWCGWSAASDSSWLTITSGGTGVGSGTITASVATNGGNARTGTITAAGLSSTVSQAAPAIPGGWANQDIGAVGKAGSTGFDWTTNVWTIKGAGGDIWGTADAFQYAYTPMTGDGVVIAHVASVSSTNAWVKAGVMIRETLDPASAQALMLVSFSKGTAFQRRTVAGGVSTNSTGPNVTAPYWVKLERIGNTFNAYASADGSAWTLVGSDTIPMAATVNVGLAVTSHVAGTLATATFDNVSTP